MTSNTSLSAAPQQAGNEAADDLSALVSVSLLQQVQEAFSAALGIPLLFVSQSGEPITRSSKLDTFCWLFTHKRETKRPCANCGRADSIKSITQPDESFKCPIGLQDIAIPIVVGNTAAGYLVTAQMATEASLMHTVKMLRGLGMAPAAAKRYASRLPTGSPERLAEVAKTLSTTARLISEVASANRAARMVEIVDPLTGLANRRYFWQCLSHELEIADMRNSPVSMLLIDLDDFKQINNTFGHTTGDKVLKTVGHILDREIRSADLAARHGSDAFLVMLKCTDSTGAAMVAWRIKNRISKCKITARGQIVHLSASIGQVTYPNCATRDPDWMYKQALADLCRPSESSLAYDRRKAA